ncbi:MAG: GspH/FimT family pseudopilin [Candidatus Krumholzibacteria bacterium]|nr:GspH/FimT family pseudopilin [Candidatus Krumholzibacteria bacterium]
MPCIVMSVMKSVLQIARNKGFTLAELMVVIGIFGIVMVLSVPAIGRFLQSWKLGGDTEELANLLRKARSAAVMKNIDAVLQFNTGNGEYFYFEDNDGDGSKDSDEYQSETITFSAGIRFNGHTLPDTKVTFKPQGNAMESGTITVANVHGRTRTISLYGGTGNVSVN